MSSAKTPQQQRQLILLGSLGVLLVLVVAFQFWPGGSDSRLASGGSRTGVPARSSTPPRAPAPGSAAAAASAGEVEPVRLERLATKGPEPTDGRRNPFSLEPEAPPPSEKVAGGPGSAGVPAAPVGPPEPTGPPPPPPIAPIALKFIGTVTVPTKVGRIAAFSDGKFVYYGREGEVIEGRYRIVKIGEESVQMEYADGKGRQTIRLSGK